MFIYSFAHALDSFMKTTLCRFPTLLLSLYYAASMHYIVDIHIKKMFYWKYLNMHLTHLWEENRTNDDLHIHFVLRANSHIKCNVFRLFFLFSHSYRTHKNHKFYKEYIWYRNILFLYLYCIVYSTTQLPTTCWSL